MRHKVIKVTRSSVAVFLLIGALLVGVNVPWANATVSTSYQLVSPRISGASYANYALIESPHAASGDGRYVAFSSSSDDIISGDTNGESDVFVRDTVNNVTTRVSVSTSGTQSNAYSRYASISYDGRYVVFESAADNLTSGVTGTSTSHIYLRDLVNNTTALVDTSSSGSVSNSRAINAKVSADGRFVVFSALSSNLVTGINSLTVDQVYIKDMHSGAIKALSVTSGGVKGDNDSVMPDISCSGNVVVFATVASNLGGAGTSGRYDLTVVHLGWSGDELNTVTGSLDWGINANYNGSPQISCNGNIALYVSSSTNAVSPSTPSGYNNAYEYNRLNGNTVQVSLGNGNVQASSAQQGKSLNASMSDDGRYVAFTNFATNLDTTYSSGTDTGTNSNVYIRDVKSSTTELATILPTGVRSGWASGTLSISPDGSAITLSHLTPHTPFPGRSLINGLTTGSATNSSQDIFKTTTGH